VDNSVSCGQLRQEATFAVDEVDDDDVDEADEVVVLDFSDEELDFSDDDEEEGVVEAAAAAVLLSERLSVR
jgi:hypothetical protein